MKNAKSLIISLSIFASCTLFCNACNNQKAVETPPTKPARVLIEEQQDYNVKKVYDAKTWKTFSEKGAFSVRKYKELHDKSIDEKGYGLFYGSASRYKDYIQMFGITPYQSVLMEQMLSDEKFVSDYLEEKRFDILERAALRKVLLEQTPLDFKSPKNTDCLEWCLLNMRKAYNGVGMSRDWEGILETAVKNSNTTQLSKKHGFKGLLGTELSKELVKNGWVALYYNPDTELPKDKPAVILPKEEVKKLDLRFLWFEYFVQWTEHIGSYKEAKENKIYYGIPITDMITDYNPTTELKDIRFNISAIVSVKSPTVKKTDKVEKIKKIPFGLLLARGGQHSAIISYGKVYELHHGLGPTNKSLIEVKDFETEWNWLSGVIIVPPNMWQAVK
ncbi:hypothetical protein FJZ53_02605 [Candidatus Woesearchaeota archaeon]|nr:hypothetical protein [Candidatus Woesearchaeota archaeon]